MVEATLAVGTVFLVFVIATVWSSYHTVSDGDVEILFVFGDPRQVLEPGVYFVPPFVSATYPIDLQTLQYRTGRGRRSIPVDYRDEVERIATDRAREDPITK